MQLCLVTLLLDANLFPHSLHSYAILSPCVIICSFNPSDLINALSHNVHLYGLTPVCDLKINTIAKSNKLKRQKQPHMYC